MLFKRFFGVFTTAVLLLSAVACSKDPEVLKREYVESGDRYVAEKKYREAVVEYRNAVQQDPRFGEARKKLAETYTALSEVQNAYSEYIRAADLLPEDMDVQLKAGALLLLAQQFEDAGSRATKVLAKDPANIDALLLRANALAGLKKMDEALAQVEQAVKADPDRGLTYTALGSMRVLRKEPEKAQAAFEQAVKADPKAVQARMALANFFAADGKMPLAERELKAALEIDPSNVQAYRALSRFYLVSNRVAEAEPYFKKLADLQPNGVGKLSLGEYYILTDRPALARALFEELVRTNPEQFVAAKLRLAGLTRTAGDTPGALKLVEEAVAKNPRDADALASKATLLTETKKYDEAVRAAQAAVDNDPLSFRGHYALGHVQRFMGQGDKAIASFTQALSLNPQLVAAEIELAQVHLAGRKLAEAEQVARSALAKAPGNVDVQLTLGRVLLAKNDTAGAGPMLRALGKALPANSVVQTHVGQLELQSRNEAAARAAFERALASDPTNVEALNGLTILDFNAKQPDVARARLDAAARKESDNAAILMLAGRAHIAVKDFASAETVLRKALDVDSANGDVYALLGNLYLQQGKAEAALKEFKLMVERRPEMVGPRTMIAMILDQLKRRDEAKAAYRDALGINPRAPVAANNLAWMYAEDGERLDEALKLAQAAKQGLPEAPNVADTLGWVYLKKGLADPALTAFREAADRSPNNPMFKYHLGLAYEKKGDMVSARGALEAALKLDSKSPQAAETRAALSRLTSGS